MEKRQNIIPATLMALSALMIAAGIADGQPSRVLAKAGRICLGWIGIG